MKYLVYLLVLGTATPVLAETGGQTLRDAFKKEFAFLEAEQVILEKRLAELNTQTKDDSRRQGIALEGLQRQIVAKTTEADAMAEDLIQVEREVDALGESEDALSALAQQMSRSLESAGVVWTPNMTAQSDETAAQRLEREAKEVQSGFEMALSTVGTLGQVRKVAGHFFLADGKKVEGTLIRVGRVAVYGVSGQNAGALTPAGNNNFKLDPVHGEDTARALSDGRTTSDMGVFLYDNTDKNFEPKREKTVHEVIQSGGIIAWVIVGLGIFALLLILIRTVLLYLSQAKPAQLWLELEPLLVTGDFEAAEALCKDAKGPAARLMTALCPALNRDREDIENVYAERMLVEEAGLDRFGALILVIAAVAPLLGLLGTVTGMISTFDVITEFGTGNPKLLSGGISEALVTTELGLCVAIPALLLGNILNGWSAKIKAVLEFACLRMVNRVRLTDPDSEGPDNVEALWPSDAEPVVKAVQ